MPYRKRRPTRKLKKRGFNASWEGWGVKASMGYKRSLAGKVTSIVRRNIETPHHFLITEQSQILKQLTHYTLNPFSGITQGDGNSNRNGDVIHIDAIKLKMLMLGATDDNPVSIRVMFVKSREEYSPSSTWVAGLGSSELYINSPSNVTCQGIVDPKKCTIVQDWKLQIDKQLPGTVSHKCSEYTLKLDQKFLYDTGRQYGKNNNLYLVVSGYRFGATIGTTDIATIILSADVIFKNCK